MYTRIHLKNKVNLIFEFSVYSFFLLIKGGKEVKILLYSQPAGGIVRVSV